MAKFVFINLASAEDEEIKVIEAVNESAARLKLPDTWDPEPRRTPTLTPAEVWSKHEAAVAAVLDALQGNTVTAVACEKLKGRRTRWAHVAACLLGV